MWLYYMPLIVKKIIRNLKPSSLGDLNSEWPTRYHVSLYEIVSSLLNWIRSAKEVPTDQENIVLNNENLSHENGNIPKSSVLALVQVLRYILLSSTVTLSFKVYILEIVLMTLKDLRNNKNLSGHARVLEKAIINGGFGYPDNPMYLTELKAAYDQVDIKLRFEDQEFANALNKA